MLRSTILIAALIVPGFVHAQDAKSLQILNVTARGTPGNIEIVLHAGEPAGKNLTTNPAADHFPAWSPDGKKIAFCSNRDGVFNVYTMNADGTDATKVTDLERGSKAYVFCPTWSPDGASIAYQRREGDKSELFTVELESGRIRNLTENAWDPAWSPSGDKLVFTGLTDKGWSLYTIEPDGGKRTEILTMDNKQGFVYPSWSPSGKRIAFTRPVEGAFEIHLCDPDGGNLKQLTKEGRMNTHCVWSPDGKKVCFIHDVDGKLWQWKTADVESGKTEAIKEIAPEPYVHGARISLRAAP